MAYELKYTVAPRAGTYRLPRRFETFDEAWETAKKVADLLREHPHDDLIFQFIVVD